MPLNNFGLHGNFLPAGLNTNNVGVAPLCGFGHELGLSGAGVFNQSGPFVSWRTKPRAQVYTGSDPCIRLLHILDIHASDVPNTSGSNVNATQLGLTLMILTLMFLYQLVLPHGILILGCHTMYVATRLH